MSTVGILLIFLGAAFAILLQGLRRVPAQPPTVAVMTYLGERTGQVKPEGWRFFFFCPWLYGFIPVEVAAKNQDFNPENVRTPDMAELEISAASTWRPDLEHLLDYLNSGGEVGVRKILDDMVEEAVRERAANPDKEPKTWEAAVKSKELFAAEVAAVIMGRSIDSTPQGELENIAIELRRGNGRLSIEKLGIILSRLNITNIKVKGELARDAENVAREEKQRQAETVELNHVLDRFHDLAGKDAVFPVEKALELIQTERKKITKTVQEFKLDTETARTIAAVLAAFARGR